MNIKQNIVRIKTASQIGSGIIYPCEINENEFGKTKFIIFTNKHLFDDLSSNKKDIKLFIDIDIYDNNGELIDIYDNKVSLNIFIPKYENSNKLEDIVALLLVFHYQLNLDLETKILWEDINLDKIFIEGFLQILYDNDISSKIQMQGRYKNIYPSNGKIGVFQILDDYHWYSNYKDLRLFQGFSGSPIYNIEKDSNFIVGMNQSVSNIEDGENPFKLLYYYKIKFVLEYLREQGCIIFRKNKDSSVSIKWIDGNGRKSENEKNILLLGSSGAGKSSFAKTFLLHSNLIDSTNDGQTTRSNIIYELSLFNEKPEVEIKFLDQDGFLTRMTQLNYENYLLHIIKIVDKENSVNSLKEYVQKLYIENKIPDENNKKNIKDDLFSTNKSSFEEEQNFINNLYDIAEKYIETIIPCFDDFTQQNKEMLNTILLNVEGFFNINEFDFLNDYKDETDPCNIDGNKKEKEKATIINYFDEFYKNTFRELLRKLKGKDIVSENNYSFKISLNNNKETLELLPLCLQVKNKKSLTGIVDYVRISDSVSNEYAFILNNLDIKTLKLIDTYGLDHANCDQGKSQVLSNILYNLQDKKLIHFNSDLAVAYIKKLDSGKPTELKSIIPQIYSMIPQAPVYCVLNGLDIFLGSKISEFESLNYLNSVQGIPKSVEYLISEKGKNDILNSIDNKNLFKENDTLKNNILNSIDNKNLFKENLYDTLKNNIILFCSDEEKIKKYYNIYNNNRNEIYKLLLSISMKEYSSMNIVPCGFIEDLTNKKYDEKINKIIETIFVNSSKTNWRWVHWKTRRANFSRTSTNQSLGYWGTYEHRWNQLFHRGYVNTTTQMEGNLLEVKENESYISAVDSCIKNMEEHFLGQSYQLANIDIVSDEKSEFRKLIETMYEEGVKQQIYKTNPFIKSSVLNESSEEQYLNDVCDFEKGYKLINDQLSNLFKECLIDTINIENKAKSDNLLKINYDFYSQMQKLEYEFEQKYDKVKFNELLKYCSENN